MDLVAAGIDLWDWRLDLVDEDTNAYPETAGAAMRVTIAVSFIVLRIYLICDFVTICEVTR